MDGGIIIKILCFGSLNIDYVYSLDHIVLPGETISADSMEVFCGGKGLNQSIAMARAGASVYHAGKVGEDGNALIDMLIKSNVNTDMIFQSALKSGHAIIQVNRSGQNSILLYPGANNDITKDEIDSVLDCFSADDLIVLQNEINNLEYVIEKSFGKGMKIALNVSPISDDISHIPLGLVSYIFVNEIEGEVITGERDYKKITDKLLLMYPSSKIIVTLGKKGVIYKDETLEIHYGIYDVSVVDTTAAGDTFTGYFLSSIAEGTTPQQALAIASAASSLSVSRKGAAVSIPYRNEVNHFMDHTRQQAIDR